MSSAIDYFSYDNPFIKVKTYFSCKARNKMYRTFIEEMHPDENDEILDLGTTPDTKLRDSNFFEKEYPYKSKLSIASIEDCSNLVDEYHLKQFKFNYPKRPLPFEDKEFDVLFSSAVLEHVGTREDQIFFLKECMRVSHRIFLTTPNRYFPLEMHTFIPFLHWLPWPIFQKIVKKIKGEFWADINNLNLLSKRDLEEMGLDLKIKFVRTCGIKSNIIVLKI